MRVTGLSDSRGNGEGLERRKKMGDVLEILLISGALMGIGYMFRVFQELGKEDDFGD